MRGSLKEQVSENRHICLLSLDRARLVFTLLSVFMLNYLKHSLLNAQTWFDIKALNLFIKKATKTE